MEPLDLDVATEFLLIAATLVELKARRLLPGRDDVDLDDELALWEERDLLLARLLECKTFKDAAGVLAALADDAGRCRSRAWPGSTSASSTSRPTCSTGVTPDDLRRRLPAGRRAQAGRRGSTSTTSPRSGPASPTPSPSCSTSCPASGASRSARSPASLVERLEVVVRFLAVLELFKQGCVELDQAEHLRRHPDRLDRRRRGRRRAGPGLARRSTIDVYEG